MKPQLEKQLLKRLKLMGLILLGFALGALFFNLIPSFSSDVDAIEEEIALEIKEEEPAPLNPFFVSSVFGIVGVGCIFISWKKRKRLFSASPENRDPE
jgi:cytochrome c biogenesis protein CcdA